MSASRERATAYTLRFRNLFNAGRELAFPCDSQGRVDLDTLSERARANYLYARALVGREYECPRVTRVVDAAGS